MIKKLSLLLLLTILMTNLSYAEGISNKDVEKEEISQEKIKQEVIAELTKSFNSLEEFNEVGTLYWENGKLKIGIKSDKISSESSEKYSRSLEAIKNKANHNVEIMETKYTTNDLINLIPEVRKEYLSIGNEENLITIATREDLGMTWSSKIVTLI